MFADVDHKIKRSELANLWMSCGLIRGFCLVIGNRGLRSEKYFQSYSCLTWPILFKKIFEQMQEFKCNKRIELRLLHFWLESICLALPRRSYYVCPQALVLDCFRGSWGVLLATFTVVIRPAEASDLGISNKMPENPEIWKAVGMLDHFEKIQKLKDKIDGVPNFRRVPGYKVFVCGQPTKEGFAAALEKACGDKWPKDGPIIWLNMRQEPILYVNGNPVCARPPNKIGEYAELGDVTRKYLKN